MKYLGIIVFAVLTFMMLYFIQNDTVNDAEYFRRQSKNEQWGEKYNTDRIKLGIPVIEQNWYTKEPSIIRVQRKGIFGYRTDSNPWSYQYWSNFDRVDPSAPFHKEKEIHRFTLPIDHEIDRYLNKVSDSTELLLEIKYRYKYSDERSWTASLIETKTNSAGPKITSVDLQLQQADSILKSWKLSRIPSR